jgi:hypothetical protein
MLSGLFLISIALALHVAPQAPASSVPLAEILEKAGDRVQQYATNIQRVACTELTLQLQVEPDLKTVKKKPIELVYV